MDIPAVFARFADDGVTLSEGHFKRTVPVLDGPPLPVSAVSEKINKENRNPVLIADYNSLYGRYFCEKIMKHVRVRGASMWLMTYIETTEDLFDAFNYNADVVVSPYHASESDAVLRDVYDVSDSFIPAVYVYRGKGVSRKGKPEDLRRMLDAGTSLQSRPNRSDSRRRAFFFSSSMILKHSSVFILNSFRDRCRKPAAPQRHCRLNIFICRDWKGSGGDFQAGLQVWLSFPARD